MIIVFNFILIAFFAFIMLMVAESFPIKDTLLFFGAFVILLGIFNGPNLIGGKKEVYKSVEVQYFISTTKVLDKNNKVHEIQELGLKEFSDLLNHSSNGKPLYIVREKTVSAKIFDNNFFNRYIGNYKVRKTNTVEN